MAICDAGNGDGVCVCSAAGGAGAYSEVGQTGTYCRQRNTEQGVMETRKETLKKKARTLRAFFHLKFQRIDQAFTPQAERPLPCDPVHARGVPGYRRGFATERRPAESPR